MVSAAIVTLPWTGGRASKCPRRLRPPQVHVFLNQIVGSTRIAAASGPRLATVIFISRSSESTLAYSTNTSK